MQKTPAFSDERFGKAVKTAFSSSDKFFWRRIYIQQSILIFYSLSSLEQKNVSFALRKNWARVITLHSSWPGEHFAEKELLFKAKVSSLLGIETKSFGVFLIFLSILWELHSMCAKEIFDLKKDLSIGPGDWTKTFQSTGRNSSENLSKKQCLLQKNILEGLFWKKKLLEISYNERNLLDFQRNVFLKVVRTALPNSSRKIWWWLYL